MDRLKELLSDEEVSETAPLLQTSPIDQNSEFVEIYAYSIEEGLEKASKRLNTSISDLEYEILEKASNGFLGIGRKPFRLLIKRTISQVPEEVQKLDALTGKMARGGIIENMDGYYKIRITKRGILLGVFKPKGRGRTIALQEVQNALYQRSITNVDQNLIQNIVKQAKGEYVKIGGWTANPELDGKFAIEVSEDQMKAYLRLVPPRKTGRIVELDDVQAELPKRGIVFGINEKEIINAIDNEKYNQPVLIADSLLPKDGENARLDYKFKVEKEVELSEDEKGRVDFHELDLIENVVVGQVLAKCIPATKGVPGKTVTGRELPAKDGKDIQLVLGKNTKFNEDQTEIIAEINGQVVYAKGKISVEPVYEVKGDVNLETGNIVFLGTVIVRGSVEDGFSIKAAGNIDIRGSVGKAQLEAEGDIIIKQGLLGKDEAIIIAGNDIIAKFIEHTKTVEAGRDIIVAEGIMHSFVDAGKRVICNGKRAMIVGGRIRAGEEINAKVIGSTSFTETEVEVGVDPKSRQQLLDLNEESRQSKDKVRDLGMNINTLKTQKKASGNKLAPEKEEMLMKMLSEREDLMVRVKEVDEQSQK